MHDEELRAELLVMPKPKVDDVAVSVAEQAKYILLVAAGFLALAGIFHGLSIYGSRARFWQFWAMGMCVFAATPALWGAIWALWAFVQNRKLRRMVKGEYYVRWLIDRERLLREFETVRQLHQKMPKCFAWLVGGFGLFFAAGIYADGDRFFESLALHFAVPLGVGAAGGYIVGWFVRAMSYVTERIARTRTPQVIVGPAGIYLPGRFCPARTVGQRFVGAALSNEKPDVLLVNFAVTQRHGGERREELPVPFPVDERAQAEMVCELINERV